MRRRQFIAGLGSAAAWPVVVRAQQGERVRQIGVLMAFNETDPEGKARLSGFTQGLTELGWIDGRNVRLDVRWDASTIDRMRMFAKELVALQPDVIFATTSAATAALQRETRTIPIVFASVSDPIEAGFVASLPRPRGNVTGFGNTEAGMVGKWLQLLMEIAPSVKRVAIMFNPDTAPSGGSYHLPLLGAAARTLKVEPITAPGSLGREPGGALVFVPDNFITLHRAPIVSLAAQNNVPAVYFASYFVGGGGLLSYGPDVVDIFHRSASYVDRILRGEKPSDLPVQLPVKFEMAVNLKTAKALGLTIPETLLATADEVIQ
jgi:putative tryptophan/tyrosine transport system substrate-binding protein